MAEKTLDEIANAIWQKGYNAGLRANEMLAVAERQSYYDLGYRQALHDMAQWSPEETSPDAIGKADRASEIAAVGHALLEQAEKFDASTKTLSNKFREIADAERAPTRTRALRWLSERPDGASHTEWVESGVARDHAALWRLRKAQFAWQDPDTLRYHLTEKGRACLGI